MLFDIIIWLFLSSNVCQDENKFILNILNNIKVKRK